MLCVLRCMLQGVLGVVWCIGWVDVLVVMVVTLGVYSLLQGISGCTCHPPSCVLGLGRCITNSMLCLLRLLCCCLLHTLGSIRSMGCPGQQVLHSMLSTLCGRLDSVNHGLTCCFDLLPRHLSSVMSALLSLRHPLSSCRAGTCCSFHHLLLGLLGGVFDLLTTSCCLVNRSLTGVCHPACCITHCCSCSVRSVTSSMLAMVPALHHFVTQVTQGVFGPPQLVTHSILC
jgi:hypothetical protein